MRSVDQIQSLLAVPFGQRQGSGFLSLFSRLFCLSACSCCFFLTQFCTDRPELALSTEFRWHSSPRLQQPEGIVSPGVSCHLSKHAKVPENHPKHPPSSDNWCIDGMLKSEGKINGNRTSDNIGDTVQIKRFTFRCICVEAVFI